MKASKISSDCYIKNMQASQMVSFFENRQYRFVEEPMLFLFALKSNL